MKQTRKRQTMSNTYRKPCDTPSEKLSMIRKAFSNRKSRREIVGGAWSTTNLLMAMVVYGRKQNPQIVANVENKSTKTPEVIVKDIQEILATVNNNTSAPAVKNTSPPVSNDDIIKAVLEDQTVKKAIDYYKRQKHAYDKAKAAADKSKEAANKKNTEPKPVNVADRKVKEFIGDRDTVTEYAKKTNAAKEAIDQAVKKASSKASPDQQKSIQNAIKESIAQTNPISNNSKKQLTIVLPFFLQIYESLYDDKNYEGSTQISRHTTIPNRAIMEYVVREIQKIEKTHPHPQLFESIFYFWNIFNLPTALGVMMSYLGEIPFGEASESRPGQVVTIVEKQLGNTSSFKEWDKNMTKPHEYRIYTKLFGQKFNPFRYADGELLALTKHPFTTYNPHITRRDMEINVNPETGAFENAMNTSQQPLPQIPLQKIPPKTQ